MSKNVLKFVLSLKIRRLRSKLGLSLKDLSEKSGLSHSYLNEIEKGKKYPKVEKLLALSKALNISMEELVSVKMGRNLHPLLEFLESDLATSLPLSAFGIGEQDIYDLMSHSPEKFTSFLMTVSELAKSYDVSLSDLNKAALRAYLEVNHNYFPYLEQLATSFSKQIEPILTLTDKLDIIRKLEEKLARDFGVQVNKEKLGDPSYSLTFKSLFKNRGDKKELLINRNLDSAQIIYCLVKELGAQQLVSDENIKKRDALNMQFPDLLLEYQTHYFAGATLLPENSTIEMIKNLFKSERFSEEIFLNHLDSPYVPPEVFMGRLTQLLPHHFNFDQLFFLKCSEEIAKNPNSYYISQELHLGQLHHPHGVSLRERYCRRWVTIEVLRKLSDQKDDKTLLRGQVSKMGEGGSPYFCLSLGQKRPTDGSISDCFTLGLAINDNFKKHINFHNDPQIEAKVVGRTCERCSIEDCKERAAPATIFMREMRDLEKRKGIEKILKS